MTREQFAAGLAQRLRNVLQKHEREMAARENTRVPGELTMARTNLDSALAEVCDFVFDALDEKAPLYPTDR